MLGLLVERSCQTLWPVALLSDFMLQETKYPFVPFLLEGFQDLYLCALCNDRVVDGMIGDQLEVPEAPVEGNS